MWVASTLNPDITVPKRVEIWYDASNGSFWWENGPSASVYGIPQLSSIHFNICLIWLISCNAENACYEACVFEMLVALWRVDWVLVVPCVGHIGQLRLDAVCQKLMTTYACWMSAIWWFWFWWICGTNKMLNSRYFAYCCCLLLRTQNEPETLLLPTSAVALSFGECWVDPTLRSWVLLDDMCRWTAQGSYFSIQPKSNLNWFEGRVCDPMKDVLRAKH